VKGKTGAPRRKVSKRGGDQIKKKKKLRKKKKAGRGRVEGSHGKILIRPIYLTEFQRKKRRGEKRGGGGRERGEFV